MAAVAISMKTVRLDTKFDAIAGVSSQRVRVFERKSTGRIPYLRPAKSQERTIAGWVERAEVPAEHIHPSGSLFVSTNGEGSHTYAYVSSSDFAANSDISILRPKSEMSIAEKIFYAQAISLNRAKFSYGRKPKGGRLGAIKIPDRAPEWVMNTEVSHDTGVTHRTFHSDVSGSDKSVHTVPLSDIFEVEYGNSLELNRLTKSNQGVNFVARTSKNNGVTARVQPLYDVEPIPGMTLTVAAGGSVLETFLQMDPFYSGYHIFVLRPKIELTLDELLYYSTCIRANQYKYSYGRQANRTLRSLLIPASESIPNWVNGTLEQVMSGIQT